jgi:hypothetical protein
MYDSRSRADDVAKGVLLRLIFVFCGDSLRVLRGVSFVLWLGFGVASAQAAAPGDVMAPIRQGIDGFNKGDNKTAFAAYSKGEVTVVDEFAPFRWTGPGAEKLWADAYGKHATATGVSDGSVSYGEPTRTEIAGDRAYVVVPTVYTYKDHGKPTVEEGQMTFVLRVEEGSWKIRGWTWSGGKPHPAK